MMFLIRQKCFLIIFHAYFLLLNRDVRIEANDQCKDDYGSWDYKYYYQRRSKVGTASQKGNGLYSECGDEVKVTRLTVPQTVGEDPFYDKKRKSVYYVDQNEGEVLRYEINTGELYSAKDYYKGVALALEQQLPGRSSINSKEEEVIPLWVQNLGDGICAGIIPIKGECDKFVITFQDKVCILTWDGKSTNTSYKCLRQPDPQHPWPKYYVAEAKIGQNGQLYFYSRWTITKNETVDDVPRGQSTFYDIINGQQKTLVSKLNFGNGVGYYGRKLYLADTPSKVIYSMDFDLETNSISNLRVLLNYSQKGIPGEPDSMTIDSEGFIWMCNNDYGSRVMRVNPNTGNVVCSVKVPAVNPTNVAFGECPNRNDGEFHCLYLTSLKVGLTSPTVDDGAMFLIEGVQAKGFPPFEADYNLIFNDRIGQD